MDEEIQRLLIFNYCREHGSITIRDAQKLDINSPTKRISEMRHHPDFMVDDIWETRINSKGIKKRYKRYFIKAVAADG